MKRNTKIILTALSLTAAGVTLGSTTTISPIFAASETTNTTDTQNISMSITKSGTSEPSMAASFLGTNATVATKDGKVTSLTIHVDGNSSPMTKGQDVSNILESATLNGAPGQKENITKDGFDLVFPASAYQAGKGTISFALNIMGTTMNESADVTLDNLKITDTNNQNSNPAKTGTSNNNSNQVAEVTTGSTSTSSQVTNNANQATANDANTQTISMAITKTGTTTSSEAADFLGNSISVTLKDGKVANLTIHVDGSKSPMTKGQDVSKMIDSVTLNGAAGQKENIAKDGSSFDLVFPASAYKDGKGTISFTLNVMGKTMNESADVTLGNLQITNNTNQNSNIEKTDITNKNAKKIVMANSYVYNKTGKRIGKKTIKLGTTIKVLGTKTINHSRYYQISKDSFIKAVNVDGTKRTLKKNAYTYTANGKRANKKLLKKGAKIATYGKVVTLHGKTFYRVSKNTYVRKANF